ncbi:TonB-dependent receptor [Chryseolinea sp. T2]|uniref:SusC/RagA family TonB-linked outer membrane protein n=1 Tax=Chryseolinea sp. T2 TaxID=3129255 RepID=UPI00307839E0
MKRFLLLTVCSLSLTVVTAQQRNVTGRVTDSSDDSPLPGVSVLLKGTNTGTTTDGSGTYTLAVDESAVLVFSFIGYESQEVVVGTRTTVDLAMKPSVSQLSEVVVIGYGEKSRAMLTESIGTIDSKAITQMPVATPEAALQGRISGVQITSVDGTPGSPVAIRIRGVGTVGNTAPLYVIDGVPVMTSLVNGNFDTSPNASILSTINPSDIESISVLKDASAAAVYGVRAANGVVLITTKRGKSGVPKIAFDTYFGVQNFPKLPKWNNTGQYVSLTEEANANYNSYRNLNPGDAGYLTMHPDLQPGSPYLNVNTDWQDAATVTNAPIFNSNLSVSGGTEATNYFVSLGYFDQEALIPHWDMSRYTFRANSDYKVGKKFKFGQTLTLSYQDTKRGSNNQGDGFIFSSIANMPPFMSIYDDPNNPIPGNRYGFNGNLDVAGLTMQNQYGVNTIVDNHDRYYRLLGGIYAELEILKGLRFRSAANLDFSYSNNTGWNPGYTAPEMGIARPQAYTVTRGEAYTQVFTNTLTYTTNFGDHSLNVLAGFEFQKLRGSELGGSGENFLSSDPDYYTSVKNAGTLRPVYSSVSNNAFAGYIGRVSYDYKTKYLLTVSVRRDGTAQFSEANRWGTFPSFSAAWRVSQESFFSDVAIVSDLKIRGSWGQLGNSQTFPFPHLSRYSATPDYGVGNTGAQAPAPVNYVNPSIKWETVETLDFGFDLSLWENKVSLLATYYDRRTKDFLFSLPIPAVAGFTRMPVNAGEVSNRGVELELGYNTTFGNGLTFNVTGNFTTVRNRLESLAEGIEEFSSGDYRTAVGYPIGYFYGYQMTGVYQTPDEATAALPDDFAGATNRPGAGDAIFQDNNGPAADDAPAGKQFSGTPDGNITPEDRTFLGKTIPGYFYGLSINAGYKGFDLSILFQGVGDVQIYNAFRRDGESLLGLGRNNLSTSQNRWTSSNPTNEMPRAISGDPYQNGRFSSRWIEDGDFLRLRNVQIGYTLPSALLQKTKALTRARIYVAGSNLFKITNYSGLDPEVMTYGTSSTHVQANTDQANIPQPRILQAGIQLEF